MLIDIRYDMELAPGAPTALICRLRVDPNREQDLQAPEPVQVQPGLQTREYFDSFDHRCSRIHTRHNTQRSGRIVMTRGRNGEAVPITMTFGTHPLTRFEVTTDEVI